MKIKSTNETENPLFNRKEVEAIVESSVTPRIEEALKLIADKYSMPQDNIKVKGVYGNFGSHEFKIIANIYKTKADKDKTEVKTKQEKAEAKAAEEAAAKEAAEKKKAIEEAAKAEKEAKAAAEAEKKEESAEAEKPAKEEVKEEVKVE